MKDQLQTTKEINFSPSDHIETPVSPILLLGFNRPALLRGLVSILAPLRPPKLYLAIDGPRTDHPEEAKACAECATVIDRIDWPCETHRLIRTQNLGCRFAVSGAIDWFFQNETEGIILEDDCWPDPSFLRFATELLARYRDDLRIGMISGCNIFGYQSQRKYSYHASGQITVWGWASWRRAWQHYEGDPEAWREIYHTIVRQSLLTRSGRTLYTRYVEGLLQHPTTWDIQWALTLMRAKQLCLLPPVNLVRNVGAAADAGTHTSFVYDQPHYEQCGTLEFPLCHPTSLVRDKAADCLIEQRSFAWLPRILSAIGRTCGPIGRTIARTFINLEKVFPALFRL